MSDEPKIKIVIAPEALAQMEREMGPEELQEWLDTLQQMADSGELFEDNEPVDLEELKKEDPDMYEELMAAMKKHGADNLEDWADAVVGEQRTLN